MRKLMMMVCLAAMVFLIGSCGARKPPAAEEIDSFVTEHREEIRTVNDYMLSLESDTAIIDSRNGPVLLLTGSYYYDREERTIEDDALREALRVLWKNGCRSIYKEKKYNNLIQYEMWSRAIGQAWCGFVYAIDTERLPKVQYQTELTPLSEEGWYYFFCDYEEWRVTHDSWKVRP